MENQLFYEMRIFGEPKTNHDVPLIVMPVADEPALTLDSQYTHLSKEVEAGGIAPFVLAAFQVESWNDDLSPWPEAGIGRGQPPFQGNGYKTLARVIESLIPAIQKQSPFTKGGRRGLLGYSMGGLFALWAVHQTKAFDTSLSCSGSLWYDGFAAYFISRPVEHPCSVYLSLGEKEEQTRNQRFASVGRASREITAYLDNEPLVQESALIWHPGGHGSDPGERIASAIRWMLKE